MGDDAEFCINKIDGQNSYDKFEAVQNRTDEHCMEENMVSFHTDHKDWWVEEGDSDEWREWKPVDVQF